MEMLTQIYTPLESLEAASDAKPQRLSDAALAELGLTAFAEQRRKNAQLLPRIEALRKSGAEFLTPRETAAWAWKLRGAYRSDISAKAVGERRDFGAHNEWAVSMTEYNHRDGIPEDVLALMAVSKDVFSALVIRTPEYAMQDPALFGLFELADDEQAVVLLARWGGEKELTTRQVTQQHMLFESIAPALWCALLGGFGYLAWLIAHMH